MIKTFQFSKYSVFVAIFSALAGHLLMLYIGLIKVIDAVKIYLLKEDISDLPKHIMHSDVATATLIQSLDAFLIAIVLMYFAFSLYHLFISEEPEKSAILFPANIAPKNIGELKETLAEVIIVVLFILFLQEIWIRLDTLEWNILIIPVSIALLSLSLKLVDFKK